MPNSRQIALNNNAGAFVDILATLPSKQVQAMEDEASTTMGIQVKTALDNFTTTNVFSFGSEPIILGNIPAIQNNQGSVVGRPAQNAANGTTAFNYRAADKLLSARSNGASGTTLRVLEYE